MASKKKGLPELRTAIDDVDRRLLDLVTKRAELAKAVGEAKSVTERGILDAGAVQHEWAQHRSGKADRHLTLWPVLMLEAWLEETGLR